MTTYVHGAKAQQVATAYDRLRAAYRTLATQAEEAERRRDAALADERAARNSVDRLLDTVRQLQEEIDGLGYDLSTRLAAGQRPRPNLWGERYQAGSA